ncbi:PEP-CTERM sorting domain-containing protein [Opitutaceae bacterium TAV4]|nr:PEP-CTERM sorting domain-containing protein [Opitutaceae bacterium TAV4]RRK01908.1 PEP-CTERM sorting domain-containing protein [Opitutaceae bacterium TAV3]
MNHLFTKHTTLSVLAASLLSPAAPQLAAQGVYTYGHGDIGVAYEDGALEPHWHLGGAAVVNGAALGGDGGEFAPNEIVAFGVDTLTVSSANATALGNLLGVSLGDSIYILGSDYDQPNLGWASEELDPADWTSANISVTLNIASFTGPGQFALFRLDEDDASISSARFSTYNASATTGNNVLNVPIGGHTHYAFGFTEAGYYELDLTFSGTHATDGLVTTNGTFGIWVGTTPVPEPATCAILLGAAGLLFALNRVRLRRKAGNPFNQH